MPDRYVTDGDVGSGEFNSREWHLCVLAQLEDSEVSDYMSGAFGVDLETREQAKEYIDEHCQRSH